MSSKKLDLFVDGPMADKDVKKIPGIGTVLGEQMVTKGITSASEVFGQFLVLKKDKGKFCDWLRKFGANNGQCNACYDAMIEWSKKYFE